MDALVFIAAILVSVFDFIFIFSSPWLALISSKESRQFYADASRAWGILSMAVGVLCVPLTAFLFFDYFQRAHASDTWRKMVIIFGLWIALPAFPFCLGYILVRFSRSVRLGD